MLSTKLKAAAGNSADATLYVDDVFSTYLYTGNGATQTITNGIDLAGKGGMVWIKARQSTSYLQGFLYDTNRGVGLGISSSTTQAQLTQATALTSFSSTGFSTGAYPYVNNSGDTYASWTFRKAAKFFDVVTYTGDGVNGRAIPHNLGVAPGMIIVKSTTNATNWITWNKSLSVPTNKALYLNGTQAELTSAYFPTLPTSSVFYTNGSGYDVNTTGQTYVAYLFAHDTSSTGIIQCGAFTTSATLGVQTTVTLGWEPQFVILKSTQNENWVMLDSMRGMTVGSVDAVLNPNLSAAEDNTSYDFITSTATGFYVKAGTGVSTNATYIYMAIRRPNKPPTSGTQVFNAVRSTTLNDVYGSLAYPDFGLYKESAAATNWLVCDRLRGITDIYNPTISTNTTSAETTPASGDTITVSSAVVTNSSNVAYFGGAGATTDKPLGYSFKRAPGFFDVVCYTSNTTGAQNIAHNLGVAPELMIVKRRNAITNWVVYFGVPTKYVRLNTTDAAITLTDIWNDTAPTASVFTVGVSSDVNIQNGAGNYVAYLFATLAGISKVGSYTGNGTSQNINCGFAAGARFILIKCTSTTGDWYVWDSARGIVSANDPHLSLNTTAAEVTTDDSVDPYAAGFTVNQVAATNINVSSATYIFLAIA